jgi:predicted RND superfamily exporter protein
MLMGWIYSLKYQTYLVFAISVLLMILILYIIFRNIVGMIVPIIDALLLTIIGLGFVGFTGINFSPLLYVLAFFVGARFISNSVQITQRYFEELNASGGDLLRACYETMRTMLFPNWTGVFTDVAGFLVLSLAKIVLMQHLAIIMGFWIFSTGITGIMVPIICSVLPLSVASDKYAKDKSQIDWQARAITKVTSFSIGSGRYVVGALIVGTLIFFTWAITGLKIGDPTPGSPLLWPSHPYNQDQALVDRDFDASSENLMLFYEGAKASVYDPVLRPLELSRHEKKLPISISLPPDHQYVKMMNVRY